MPTAIILSGVERYSDPWHPYPETSPRLAAALADLGITVAIVPTTPDELASLDTPDLLVVDAGGGNTSTLEPITDDDGAAWAAAHARLGEVLATGVPLLVVHASANAFVDVPAFRERSGGHWETGTSFHPDRGPATFLPASEHPILAGLASVEVDDDERYSALDIDDDVTPLLVHDVDGVAHVAAWVRDDERGRVVYDGLGHYAPSYDAPARTDLLQREVRWLLGL